MSITVMIRRITCRSAAPHVRGFTLLEVMVALVITSIGLLGIAKIQALAYASTGSAGMRSLVAIQATGLGAAMHADRGYWSAGTAPLTTTIQGPVITSTDTTLSTPATCYNVNTPPAACSVATMAAYDLQTYANALNAMLGNSNPLTTITCTIGTGGAPNNCTIGVTWSEKAVSINTQSVNTTNAATFAPTYTLYVTP
jgi:type IV pilus assembly protein PilV